MMRLFLTSFQKSGTHQIMPALGIRQDIVDRSLISATSIPERYGTPRVRNEEGVLETCKELREFKHRAFGHIAYNPEYAECLQAIPTKVIFNVRDPRDVVVANYYNIMKIYYKGKYPGAKGNGHLNMWDAAEEKLLINKNDPIAELIEIEASRWPHWLGWLQHDFVMMVHYEDFREEPRKSMERVFEFIAPHPIDQDRAIRGLHPNPNNPTFRTGRIGDWKMEFKAHHKKMAEKLLGKILVQLGYRI